LWKCLLFDWFHFSFDFAGALKLQFNRFKGTIPAELFSGAKDLVILNVGFNSLTGHVPDAFEAGNKFEQLHFQNNQLTGPLPLTMEQLTHLEYLEMDHNQFTGWIPHEWGGMTNLEILRIVSWMRLCCVFCLGWTWESTCLLILNLL